MFPYVTYKSKEGAWEHGTDPPSHVEQQTEQASRFHIGNAAGKMSCEYSVIASFRFKLPKTHKYARPSNRPGDKSETGRHRTRPWLLSPLRCKRTIHVASIHTQMSRG